MFFYRNVYKKQLQTNFSSYFSEKSFPLWYQQDVSFTLIFINVYDLKNVIIITYICSKI